MLAERIKTDLIRAMKAGQVLRVSVLRLLLSAIGYKQIELQHELNDEEILAVIRREVKKRRQASESFAAGGRHEQADKEKRELEILQEYLPADG